MWVLFTSLGARGTHRSSLGAVTGKLGPFLEQNLMFLSPKSVDCYLRYSYTTPMKGRGIDSWPIPKVEDT